MINGGVYETRDCEDPPNDGTETSEQLRQRPANLEHEGSNLLEGYNKNMVSNNSINVFSHKEWLELFKNFYAKLKQTKHFCG